MTGLEFISFIRNNDLDYQEISLGALWNVLALLFETDEANQTFTEFCLYVGFSKRFIAALLEYAKENNYRDIKSRSGLTAFETNIEELWE
jgi:hypothetical protein